MSGGLATEDATPPRHSRRHLLIGLASALVGIAVIIAIVWQLTAGLTDTANGFLSAVAADDMSAARTFLTEDWSDAPEDRLRKLFTDFGLTQYESASWTSRSVEGSTGTLAGTMRKRRGDELEMSFSMAKERGEWKIVSFHLPISQIPPGYTERTQADRAKYCAKTGKC